jgi:hypothetical protein
MRTYIGFFLVVLFCSTSVKAQDVYIDIPASNIFNRTEFITNQNVLNTGTHTSWRTPFIGLAVLDPTIKSTSGNNFTHTTLPVFLSTNILHWRLASIGGHIPPFRLGDVWPVYKWFITSEQTWYQPITTLGYRTPGNVVFTFKVPSEKFTVNSYHAGNYSLGVTHNYGTSSYYAIEFTPDNLQVILRIPSAISWLSNTPTKYIEINDLNAFRSTGTYMLGNLGNAELGNTVNFNFWAKASSSLIQFTSSKGVQGSRDISTIKLGSTSPKLTTLPLSGNSQTYSTSNFIVENGNRNNFTLDLSVSADDFKTHFFEAGTYTFQLNLDAISTDNTVSSSQNTDVTINVLPLSEINISSGHEVNFNFNTAMDYQQGKSKVMPNHIKLSNNENFELYVKAGTNFFKKAGVQSDINSNILEVGVDGISALPLSITPQKIISAGAPVLDGELDIKYNISPTAAQSLVGKEKTTYAIDVIYSFTAL